MRPVWAGIHTMTLDGAGLRPPQGLPLDGGKDTVLRPRRRLRLADALVELSAEPNLAPRGPRERPGPVDAGQLDALGRGDHEQAGYRVIQRGPDHRELAFHS